MTARVKCLSCGARNGLMVDRLLSFFEEMEREKFVLDHLTRIDLVPQRGRLIASL